MKKWLAMFLLCCLLVPLLTACPGGETPGGGGGGGGDGETESDFIDSLGDRDYGDDTFLISALDLYDYEVYAAEDSKEVLDEEVYTRNKKIEDRFHIRMDYDWSVYDGTHDTHIDHIRRVYNSGSDTFDIAMLFVYKAGILVTGSMLYDLRLDIPYVKDSLNNMGDPEKSVPWWSEDINTAFTVNGCQYVGVSDFCITAMNMTYAMLFNKQIDTDNNISKSLGYESMYDIVRQGDWTIDLMRSMVKDRYEDSTTTGGTVGAVDVETDSFGFLCDTSTALDQFAPALNIQYVINNGVDTPELFTMDGRTVQAFGDVYDLFLGPGNGAKCFAGGADTAPIISAFTEGRSFMVALPIYRLSEEAAHDMEDDFGIIPYPKAEGQAEYHSGTVDNYSVICVLSALLPDRLELVGTMIEALSAETNNSVIEPYYNLVVTHKDTRDPDSVEMLKIIMDGRLYDFATLHYTTLYYDKATQADLGLGLLMRNSINDRIADITSFWASVRDQVSARLDDLVYEYEHMYD